MLTIQKKLLLLGIGLACGFIVGIFVFLLSSLLPAKLDLTKNLEFFYYNLSYRASSEKPSSKLILIDAEDVNSSRSRGEYADLIRRLHRAGAQCIALDIRFLGDRLHDQSGDLALVESVKECPNVILSMNFGTDYRPNAVSLLKAKRLALPDSLCQDLIPLNEATKGVELPFDTLLSVAPHLGHINSADNQFYHFPPVLLFEEKCFAALPVEIVRHYFESPTASTAPEANVGNSSRTFQLSEIPLDKYGRILVNFIPVEAFRPRFYSWPDAFKIMQSDAGLFQGAIVVIINPFGESPLATPAGPYPSWALLASLINQLLLDHHIDVSVGFGPASFNAILISLGLFWLLFLAPRFDPKWRRAPFVFGVGNLLCLLLVYSLLHFGRQWVGVVTPLLGFNLALVLVRAIYKRMTKPAQYVDFELSVAEGEHKLYSIQVIKSPVGEEEDKISLQPFWEQKKFQDVSQRLNELEATREDLIWIGDKFFAALFPNVIFNVLRRSLDVVKRDRNNLRLKLRLDAPELMYLPWELMHNKKLPGGFLALLPHVSLTRYLPLEQPLYKPQFRVPMRILVLISSRADLPPLNVEAEKEVMEKALNPLTSSGDIELKIREHATRSILFDELENDPPDVLHYIGHSGFAPRKKSGFLELESEDDEPGRMSAEELGGRLLEKRVKLVVLNSCQGATAAKKNAFAGIAQNLVRAGVPAVVAMQYPIRDTSALMFSEVFYSTLIKRYSIDDAVAMTRRTLSGKLGSGQQDWATPVLFMRAADEKIFEIESP